MKLYVCWEVFANTWKHFVNVNLWDDLDQFHYFNKKVLINRQTAATPDLTPENL